MGMLIELASGTSDTLSHLIARDDDPPPPNAAIRTSLGCQLCNSGHAEDRQGDFILSDDAHQENFKLPSIDT